MTSVEARKYLEAMKDEIGGVSKDLCGPADDNKVNCYKCNRLGNKCDKLNSHDLFIQAPVLENKYKAFPNTKTHYEYMCRECLRNEFIVIKRKERNGEES